MTNCPECDASVECGAMIAGEVFSCRDCGTELEVRATTPIAVERAPKEAEDWGE
ncbi:MAG: lysine biosynthesis protein LysW [Thermoplasmata archaeon]